MRSAFAILIVAACARTDSHSTASKPVDAAPICDLSTDDAVREAFTRVTGEHLDEKYPCISRSATFGVIRVGSFAYDRGCRDEGEFYGCAYDDPETPARAMAAAGWAGADLSTKQRLAIAWLEEVGDSSVLLGDDEKFQSAGKTFSGPHATATADGGLALRFWTEESGGELPEARFRLVETTFDARGVITGGKDLDGFRWSFQDGGHVIER